MSDQTGLSRRRVLQTVGAGVGTAGMATAVSGRSRNEYNIGLAAGVDASVATDRARSVKTQLDFGEVGSVVTGEFDDEDIRALEADSGVRYVERNGQMHALGASVDSAGEVDPAGEIVPYGIEITDADEAVDEGATGDGVTVSVIDTGIDPLHEALSGNVVGGYATESAECFEFLFDCEEPWDDDQDHGSHVAGTAAAQQNDTGVYGVAPDADLLAVKALNFLGSGDFDEIADGIEWSVDNGADVINMSLGGPESDAVSDAVEYAANNDVVVVAAAGNDGPCEDCVSAPANHPDAIAVSATDENDDLAEFSSTGPEIELAAPGADVTSTLPGDDYGEFSGTSMASPHVAGAAASVLGSGVSAGETLSALEEGAEDIGLDDSEQGAGRINVVESIGDGDDPGDPPGEELDVTTGAATDIGETTATLTGSLEDLQADEADVWFEYGIEGLGLSETADAGSREGPGEFTADVDGLLPGLPYEFRAVASTDEADDEGDAETFETDQEFCFITTATAEETETLDSLRRFRDDSMKTTPVGKGMVGLYYRISPPIARTMDRHPDSPEAAVTRRIVETSAALSDSQADSDSRVKSAMLGVLLTMLYVFGLVVGAVGHASLRARESFAR